MTASLRIRNQSSRKRLHRADVLGRIAQRVCDGEGHHGDIELSVLFCDDPLIADLNRRYRDTDAPTDVLAFAQQPVPGYNGPEILGDIVISLESAERHCAHASGTTPDPAAVRQEVRLLFCHGLLHLLGAEHATPRSREEMTEKQARYLGIAVEAAWRATPRASTGRPNSAGTT